MIMLISGYELDFSEVIKASKKTHFDRVLLQIPEGLKHKTFEIAMYLEKELSTNCIISTDPCFGACDLPIDAQIKSYLIDAIVHIGHLPIPNLTLKDKKIPIFFIPAPSTHSIDDLVSKAIPFLEGTRIGICTTAQHIHQLKQVSKQLRGHGLAPLMGSGDQRICEKSQLLGCNFSAGTALKNKVDSFLFLGSGMFHPLGLYLTVKKPVIIIDPYTKQVKKKELEDLKDSILRQRYGAIAQAKSARRFGILVGIKEGQNRFSLAQKLQKMIKDNQKEAWLILVNHLSPAFLEGYYSIDCFVSTLCPRIAIDEYLTYKTAVITPQELEIALDIKSWDEYQFDEIL